MQDPLVRLRSLQARIRHEAEITSLENSAAAWLVTRGLRLEEVSERDLRILLDTPDFYFDFLSPAPVRAARQTIGSGRAAEAFAQLSLLYQKGLASWEDALRTDFKLKNKVVRVDEKREEWLWRTLPERARICRELMNLLQSIPETPYPWLWELIDVSLLMD